MNDKRPQSKNRPGMGAEGTYDKVKPEKGKMQSGKYRDTVGLQSSTLQETLIVGKSKRLTLAKGNIQQRQNQRAILPSSRMDNGTSVIQKWSSKMYR